MRVVGVDIGGTFTDFMLYDTESGGVHVHKVPSTPGGAGAGDGQRPRRALRRRRPRDRGRDRRLPRHDRGDERGAPAPGRGRRDDHDPRLPGHRPHRPAPAAAPLLGDAGHPVAGAAVRPAPPPQGRHRADRAADGRGARRRSTRTRCARRRGSCATRASRRSPSASSSRTSTRSTSGARRRSCARRCRTRS